MHHTSHSIGPWRLALLALAVLAVALSALLGRLLIPTAGDDVTPRLGVVAACARPGAPNPDAFPVCANASQ